MAGALTRKVAAPSANIDYPTSDGKPMAETDLHRNIMIAVIQILEYWFRDRPMVYVSGNMLVYYVPGDKRRHVAPDAFVVIGVAKKLREYYLVWEEGKSLALVIEITSKTTKAEDLGKKMVLYRDVLKVKEYFMFDPREEYLRPSLQGFRLSKGEYVPVAEKNDRLVSRVLGLHLERDGVNLRFFDPATGTYVPTPEERAEMEKERADQAEKDAQEAEARVRHLLDENERLREELSRRQQRGQ